MKCSGERPSCERCRSKDMQCGGFQHPKTLRKPGRVAIARDSVPEISDGTTSQYSVQHAPQHQVPAPQHGAWIPHVDQDLQQDDITKSATLENDNQDHMDFDYQHNFLFRTLATFFYVHNYNQNT